MRISTETAVVALRPGSAWVINAFGLQWLDPNTTQPTEEEIATKIEELKEAEPMRLLRVERTKRLDECAWVVQKSYSTGQPMPVDWAEYMQALRDLPATATPLLNELGELDLSSVEWPVKPQ